jgi:NTP pyrophosphatase (non-canonical NTP hydrolase)
MSQSFPQSFARIVALGREDVKGPEAMGLKLMEEVGEFAEAINHACGYLPHKNMKEPALAEAADVVQNVICILGRLYPESSADELLATLTYYLETKTDKWEAVLVRKSSVDKVEIGDTIPAVMYFVNEEGVQ